MSRGQDPYSAELSIRAANIESLYEPVLREKSNSELMEIAESLRERAKAHSRKDPIKLMPKEVRQAVRENAKSNKHSDKILDILLPEAYSLVCEVAFRTRSMRPYHEQIMGAIALHEGKIIEMENGEGKTLTATMPAYLNGITGKRVHIATQSEYLAYRDFKLMGPIYVKLGMSVGFIAPDKQPQKLGWNSVKNKYQLTFPSRKDAYQCNIIYGTYGDFCLDYLRDNAAKHKQEIVQGDESEEERLNYIILDEADSVLIDQARMRSTITEKLKNFDPSWYRELFKVAENLTENRDFIPNSCELTDQGVKYVEEKLLKIDHLYSNAKVGVAYQLIQSLRAKNNFHKGKDYSVIERKIVSLDATGRPQTHITFSNGIQQALEAKENVEITQETAELAVITYQQFFKLYKKMAGMTASAKERVQEFRYAYNKSVVVIDPHKESKREPYGDPKFADRYCSNLEARLDYVLDQVQERQPEGQPVLINTLTVGRAKEICDMLKAKGIHCELLDAEHSAQEAKIINEAGQKGHVTVTANMAGRGTDILIEKKANDLGGLHVIGIEKYISDYKNRQLIGRTGRQGTKGTYQFLLCFEDENSLIHPLRNNTMLLHLLGNEMMPVDASTALIIRRRQRRYEENNYTERQKEYEFDSVLDNQRRRVYEIRRRALMQQDLSPDIAIIIDNVVNRSMEEYPNGMQLQESDIEKLRKYYCGLSGHFTKDRFEDFKFLGWENVKTWLKIRLHSIYGVNVATKDNNKHENLTVEDDENLIKANVLIKHLDDGWRDHIYRLLQLQEAMSLRSELEENRLEWYFVESYKAFRKMLEKVEEDFLKDLTLSLDWHRMLRSFREVLTEVKESR
jgi:preprotein translocase subunit SecA